MLDVLGDDYIAQHILQGYKEYLEQTSYKVYMSNVAKGIASMISGAPIETSWADILNELNESVTPNQKTESESEIKNRILSKLNGKGENADGCI